MTLQQRSEGRQCTIVARADFDFNDLPSTAFVPALELPANAIILRGSLCVDAVFDTDATIAVGIATDADALLAATDVDALGITAISTAANLLYGATPGAKKVYGLTASAAMSKGKGSLVLEYIREGRSEFTQG